MVIIGGLVCCVMGGANIVEYHC